MRSSIKLVGFAAGTLISALFSSPGFAKDCDAPNPSAAIAAPPASVSPNAAGFSGVWGGTWMFQMLQGIYLQRATVCARLHVSVTSSTSANVSYCSGTNSVTGYGRRCEQYTASINGNVLQFKSKLGNAFSFANQGTSLAAEVRLGSLIETYLTQFQKM